jgi:predicted NAD/FAD-binding protein
MNLIHEHGFETHPVHMMISFGKDDTAWTNYADSNLTRRLKEDIARFEKTLKIINRFEALFIFLPISKVLKWFGYSEEFMNQMVFPLTALFFGTGNQTPNVSSAIMARVFLDDDLRLFDYDTDRLLSQTPEMFAFPNLEQMYETIIKKSGVRFHRNRPVRTVSRIDGKVHVVDMKGDVEIFDEIIFACDAETALGTLTDPSFMELQTLGNVQYFNDLIITHEDEHYMNSHYELHKDKDQYLVRTDVSDPSKIEMSFDLSNYQPQLKKIRDQRQHVYQTIYLDDTCADIWTLKKVDKKKIMYHHWWRQFSHTWRHFAFTVPLMSYIQGKRNTYYCGSYTLVNTHEVAVMSGLAAAYRIGASYPFDHDALARKQFDHYLMVIHGKPRKVGLNLDTLKAGCLGLFIGIFTVFSLLTRIFVDWYTHEDKPR